MTLVVAGEALIDLVPRADGALSPALGGGPFNTARAAARLGQPTAFLGGVSRDRFGEDIAAALAAEGVILDHRLRTDRPTSLAVAELDETGAAAYRFHLAGTSIEALTLDLALAALPDTVAALHVGSLALALDPMAGAVEALTRRVSGRALVMADPNVRPAAIGDLPTFRDRFAALLEHVDVLKVSDADLDLLSPGLSPLAAVGALLERGTRLVLLTLGADGAVAFGAFGSHHISAPDVPVVDTIGAGDTFSGAWLSHWLENGAGLDDRSAVIEATAFASRAASLSCGRRGAEPPSRAEMVFDEKP